MRLISEAMNLENSWFVEGNRNVKRKTNDDAGIIGLVVREQINDLQMAY